MTEDALRQVLKGLGTESGHRLVYYDTSGANVTPICACGWRGTETEDLTGATKEYLTHVKEAVSCPKSPDGKHHNTRGIGTFGVYQCRYCQREMTE